MNRAHESKAALERTVYRPMSLNQNDLVKFLHVVFIFSGSTMNDVSASIGLIMNMLSHDNVRIKRLQDGMDALHLGHSNLASDIKSTNDRIKSEITTLGKGLSTIMTAIQDINRRMTERDKEIKSSLDRLDKEIKKVSY